MKQLMCAIAATAAGVALADVSSANIVGYATTTIEKSGQQQMVGGTFVSVGEDYIDIQDITVTGDPADESAWIKWWDPVNKVYGAKALYVSELYDKNGDAIVPTTAGWGDADWVPVEKTFAPGEGFWWGVGKDGCGLTLSGEVVQPATKYIGRTIAKSGQQQMVINAIPVELDLQDITVDGDPADESAWIKWWDPVNKVYGAKALYVSELYDKNGDAIVPTTAGWGDADWVPVEKTFAPGEGFWWGVGKDNCTLCIPNPFYVEEK